MTCTTDTISFLVLIVDGPPQSSESETDIRDAIENKKGTNKFKLFIFGVNTASGTDYSIAENLASSYDGAFIRVTQA